MIVELRPGAAPDLGDAFGFYRREAWPADGRRFSFEFAPVARLRSVSPNWAGRPMRTVALIR